MLLQLSISNFALIDRMNLEFNKGLNVFTGETGAGKSILIDALRLVLGERMEMEQVRDKKTPCVIEAVFLLQDETLKNNSAISAYLKPEDECLILRREILPEGRSKNYINQQFVNLSQLREAGTHLVDIHGQYDHQTIFNPRAHLELTDAFAGLGTSHAEKMKSYQQLFSSYRVLLEKKHALLEKSENRDREIDLLTYQVQEIDGIDPQEGEEESLKEEKIKLAHSEKLNVLTSKILEALDSEDLSASSRISAVFRDLSDWERIDGAAGDFKKRLETIQFELESCIRDVSVYQEGLVFDEGRLAEVEERLAGIETLKRKYGTDIKSIRSHLKNAKEKLDLLQNSEVYQKEVDQEIKKVLPELQEKADSLSRLRKKASEALGQAVLEDLNDLGIKYAKFKPQIKKEDFSETGQDSVEFLFSPNAGEDLRPLAEIASGGEASRIMLAIKHALAKVDKIPTLIFDEIDANVGGRLGVAVGEKLREISRERQVFLITHLPQIASFGDLHIKVKKWTEKGMTRVSYKVLEGDERVHELAQMMSGEKETEISKIHAREMLKTAAK